MANRAIISLLGEAIALLKRDVAATLAGSGPDVVDYILACADTDDRDVPSLTDWLVDHLQVHVHDNRLDTEWPPCPRHPNHPLTFDDGWWCCPRDNSRVARLGALDTLG